MQLDPDSGIKEVEAAINEFQRKLDRLKVLYEQYFMGIEKREPLVPLRMSSGSCASWTTCRSATPA